jgi:topoisomerase-4 subunit B
MNPESRNLIQVQIDDLSASDKQISILMGDAVAPRREWIESNVDFEITDDFDIEGRENR